MIGSKASRLHGNGLTGRVERAEQGETYRGARPRPEFKLPVKGKTPARGGTLVRLVGEGPVPLGVGGPALGDTAAVFRAVFLGSTRWGTGTGGGGGRPPTAGLTTSVFLTAAAGL
jgi:hypothetical protein